VSVRRMMLEALPTLLQRQMHRMCDSLPARAKQADVRGCNSRHRRPRSHWLSTPYRSQQQQQQQHLGSLLAPDFSLGNAGPAAAGLVRS
jgi:hypothetical protein